MEFLIEKEIASLPSKMKEVFELSRKANLSHRQIAIELDLSEKTVKNQVNNALKVLRLKLGSLMFLLSNRIFIFFHFNLGPGLGIAVFTLISAKLNYATFRNQTIIKAICGGQVYRRGKSFGRILVSSV
ncbi:sigma factor-like helix-turn-helix DNA-binding protein [Pedobacter steynii]